MLLISHWTSDSFQKQNLVLPDGSNLELQMYFRPNQFGWYIASLVNKSFTLQGLRLTSNFNVLRQWKDVLDFGIACVTDNNREPTQISDLSTGATKLYILTAAEVLEYEGFLQGKEK